MNYMLVQTGISLSSLCIGLRLIMCILYNYLLECVLKCEFEMVEEVSMREKCDHAHVCSGTPHSGHPSNKDTSINRTHLAVPNTLFVYITTPEIRTPH